jgi:hypothetical protein
MTWFQFADMHSGGGLKYPPFADIYVEAETQEEAERIFEGKTGERPHAVACDCCGANYSISEDETLAEATAYERGCSVGSSFGLPVDVPHMPASSWRPYLTLEAYLVLENVLVIPRVLM